MKNVLGYVFAGIAGLGLGLALRGAPQRTPPAVVERAKTQAIQESMSPVEGPVVHTFADDEQMKSFAQRWQQRQGLLLRLAMLEAYWNNEQGTLNVINQKITSDYHLDTSKNYMLESERKVIVERPASPPAEGAAAPQTPAPAAGGTPAEVVAYTFPDEAAMESFAKLWQQRQSIIVRMAVLKAYWDSEKQSLGDVDQTFVKDYNMDMAKQYSLDEKRRVLIERPAPAPAPAAPAAGQAAPGAPQAGAPASSQTPHQR